MIQLSLQRLESRCVPASTIALTGGVLSVTGTQGDDAIFVDSVNGSVQVTFNDAVTTFDASKVQSVVMVGDAGNDRIGNNTALPSVLLGDSGNDSIFGGSGNDFLDGGSGRDVLYDLPGVNTFVSRDGAFDRVFGNAQSTFLSDTFDQQVQFFAPGRGPGSGVISLENGILYVTPTNADLTVTSVVQVGSQVVVGTSWGGMRTFDRSQVNLIAFFGGNGKDIYVNSTAIDNVAYGGVGQANDTLIGGSSYNLLKGGGGTDVLIALGTDNELMGDGGIDILIGNGNTFFRKDPLDVVQILDYSLWM